MEIKKMVAEMKKKSDKKGGIKNIYFIACGGSLAGLYAGWYLMDREARNFRVGLYNASEFIQTTPKAFGEDTLCICSYFERYAGSGGSDQILQGKRSVYELQSAEREMKRQQNMQMGLSGLNQSEKLQHQCWKRM